MEPMSQTPPDATAPTPRVDSASWQSALDAFVREMVPTDDTPGAAEAGTTALVQQALESAPPLAAVVGPGLLALDRASTLRWGAPFAALPAERRSELLTLLARGSPPPGWDAGDPSPEALWATARALVVGLFYGSPAGWALCGFPGPAVDRGGYRHTIVDPDPARLEALR